MSLETVPEEALREILSLKQAQVRLTVREEAKDRP